MSRIFLAAGVAALAFAGSAGAKPGGNGGGHGGDRNGGNVAASQGGNGGRHGRGGGGFAVPEGGGHGHGGGGGFAVRASGGGHGHGGGNSFEFAQRGGGRGHGGEQASIVKDRGHARSMQVNREVHGRAMHAQQVEQRQARNLERHQIGNGQMERVHQRMANGQPLRVNRANDHVAMVNDFRGNRVERGHEFENGVPVRFANARGRGLIDGCPPGLWKKANGCLPPGQARALVGQPIRNAERIAAFTTVPYSLRTFYPDTNDYYYRYGDGYLYRVNRTSSLIASVLPLMAGGYMPGTYFPSMYSYAPGYTFPTSFMNPYVPDYYGWNAFYPDTPYVDYRYLNGNVYGIDPYSGMIENVIPTYAYGYGVGQVLPASYGYYNVPYQYRSLYYNTPDYNYWYAPGAIYQVDPASQLITAVASLLAPGMSIGQPLPLGYDVYNVPYAYRTTYYDTPTAWYRYSNGYIYQVDPATRLVTAIAASLLI